MECSNVRPCSQTRGDGDGGACRDESVAAVVGVCKYSVYMTETFRQCGFNVPIRNSNTEYSCILALVPEQSWGTAVRPRGRQKLIGSYPNLNIDAVNESFTVRDPATIARPGTFFHALSAPEASLF